MSEADGDGDAQYRRPKSESDSELGDESAGDEQGTAPVDGGDDDEIVATPDMCHHCFDALLKELLPESSSPTRSSHGRRSTSKRKFTKKTSSSQKHLNDDDDNNIWKKVGTSTKLRHDFDDMREKLEHQQSYATYTPPEVDCPLFVTWSKLRSPSQHNPPMLSEVSSSGITTPASTTTTASSSNITDTDDNNSTPQQQYQYDESDYDLRGCIGTLAPKPLNYALSEFAITSALHDHRFDPISLQEVPCLRVGVSLLVKYEECNHCFDWTVGVHGIIIKFESINKGSSSSSSSSSRVVGKGERRTYSATYLPEVAYEQQWSQQEAVLSLVRKAGYRGVISDELLSQIRCTRYQSSKYRLSYQEYAGRHHGRGVDTLQNVSVMTAAVVDEAVRQSRAMASKPCVNL